MTISETHGLVTIATIQFHQLVNFYQQMLAEEPVKFIANVYAEFDIHGLKLGIFQPQAQHQGEFTHSHQSTMSLCLEVRDLKQAIAHLTTLGYPPPGNIYTASHGQEIYAYDPDGNRIILHQSS
ncbi:VOC family protein [Calothrix sp. 336/3]|uniref:VOC family protein n=1 Tax=Calothrix sp. 336/3 TaxID=1337936 RepID=UPI0004E2AD27|nr:VOC family protein [Calothrix sp. 336/3]AKG22656.1 glyoxalase [Calothrix sp. 336/3]